MEKQLTPHHKSFAGSSGFPRTSGILRLGRQNVPPNFYALCATESDFLEAGSFEGDYRELIATLATHERVEELLPELKRENDTHAIENAVLLATVDIVRDGEFVNDVAVLAEHITVAAAHRYAAPRLVPAARRLAPLLAELLCQLAPEIRATLTGPFWTPQERFAHLRPHAAGHLGDALIVASDGRMLICNRR